MIRVSGLRREKYEFRDWKEKNKSFRIGKRRIRVSGLGREE